MLLFTEINRWDPVTRRQKPAGGSEKFPGFSEPGLRPVQASRDAGSLQDWRSNQSFKDV